VTIDADQEQIYQIQIGTDEYSRIPLTNSCKGSAIDMNPLTKTLYWNDNTANVIMKAQMDGSQEEVFKTLPKKGTVYILSLVLCQYLKQIKYLKTDKITISILIFM
jgi:hypothetical protein